MKDEVKAVLDAYLAERNLSHCALAQELGFSGTYLTTAMRDGSEHRVVLQLADKIAFPPAVMRWARDTARRRMKVSAFHDVPVYPIAWQAWDKPA